MHVWIKSHLIQSNIVSETQQRFDIPVHNLELQQTTRKVHARCTKGLNNVTTIGNEICFLVKIDLSSRVRVL